MLNIIGVGEVKYSKYGEVFEYVIKEFVEEYNIIININNDIEFKNEENDKKDNDLKLEVIIDSELYDKLYKVRSEFVKKEKSMFF